MVSTDRRVLDHVMEDGNNLGLLALDAHHRPQGMEDVGQPLLILLAFVGPCGYLQSLLDRRHGCRPFVLSFLSRSVTPNAGIAAGPGTTRSPRLARNHVEPSAAG